MAELEYEHIYQRRGLQKIGSRLSHFWENGCFKCGFIDTSNGCANWSSMTREEVRTSWWRWALPARLRLNRRKRDYLARQAENRRIREASYPAQCTRCLEKMYPP